MRPDLLSLSSLSLGLLLVLSASLLFFLRERTLDGWTHPLAEMRWLFGSAIAWLLLGHPHFSSLARWTPAFQDFGRSVVLAVAAWSLTALLLTARFNDRSCIERGISRNPHPWFPPVSDLAFLLALFLALSPFSANAPFILLLQGGPLLLAAVSSLRALEWRRVLKRSALTPLFFHFGLMASAILLPLAAFLPLLGSESNSLVETAAWLVLVSGALRMHRYFAACRRARQLALECREILAAHESGSARLHALCEFIEDEWAAARVSVISVKEQMGAMLACAGPEAIPESRRSAARKLGPFLKRVCREKHILYAPAAEELGKDLQEQGMRHSSLALPLLQQGKVKAVVCIMADEGERIVALEATVIELMVRELALEILTACAQHVAEEKCERLLAIARRADGIAVEHIDGWGNIQYGEKEEERFLLGARIEAVTGIHASPVLKKAQLEFARELKAIWQSLAAAYEFVARDTKEDFWVLSPKEFRQDFLKRIGPEQAALALALSFHRQAQALAAKQSFLLLAQPRALVAAGKVRMHLEEEDSSPGTLDTDRRDLEMLRRIRERAGSGGPAYWSRSKEFPSLCRGLAWAAEEEGAVFTLLGISSERRETKALEARALENARASIRRSA